MISGIVLVPIGIASAAFATLVSLAPEGVVAAAAGLALMGTLATSLRSALAEPGEQVPAVVTFAVAASGTTVAGVSAAFWALAAGPVLRAVLHRPA